MLGKYHFQKYFPFFTSSKLNQLILNMITMWKSEKSHAKHDNNEEK